MASSVLFNVPVDQPHRRPGSPISERAAMTGDFAPDAAMPDSPERRAKGDIGIDEAPPGRELPGSGALTHPGLPFANLVSGKG